jgi:hypothetical protein
VCLYLDEGIPSQITKAVCLHLFPDRNYYSEHGNDRDMQHAGFRENKSMFRLLQGSHWSAPAAIRNERALVLTESLKTPEVFCRIDMTDI